MDLKLNVSKNGLNLSAEGVNNSADAILHFGQVFRGADGKSAYQQVVEAGYKGSEEDFNELLLSYPNKADKDGYYPNMSVGIADDVKNGNTKYLAATPSGDPMHYAYEALGARWNADTGYWEFIGVNDMTNEDMLEEILLGNSRIYPSANVINLSRTERVIFGKKYMLLDSEWTALKAANLTPFNERLEVVQFSTYEHLPVFLSSFEWSCYECKRLRTFFNILDVSMGGLDSAFIGCVSLETIMLRGLKKDVSFADSPLLSKESLLYMIDNCASGVSFTITLHPDVDDKWQADWLEEIDRALGRAESAKNTNITLARA